MDTLKRLLEIVQNAPQAPIYQNSTRPNACWVDGDKCPYGFPNGTFQDRPTTFCHFGSGGCKKLGSVKEAELINSLVNSLADDLVKKALERGRVSLSSEVDAVSEHLERLDGEVLRLARDIIEKSAYDRDIVRVEDF